MAALTYQLVAPTVSTSAPAHSSAFAIDSTVFTTMSPDWEIFVQVDSMVADYARFSIEDSVNNFVTVVAGPTFEVFGNPLNAVQIFSFTKKQFPGLRFGLASAVLRISLTLLSGISPSIHWQSWYAAGPLSN